MADTHDDGPGFAEEVAAHLDDDQTTAPEPDDRPQFVRDAEYVAQLMREALSVEFVSEDTGEANADIGVWVAVTEQRTNAAQVLLNATQAVEMWQQQERQFRIQQEAIRTQIAEMNQQRQGAGLLMPVIGGIPH
jgi:glycine/D-amino acid oxidase-like deaminating enzyme